MSSEVSINNELILNNGVKVKNRFFKSAMSEQLGHANHAPNIDKLTQLYGAWADGGIGIQVTGNVMIDSNHIGEPKNVVLENEKYLESFRQWTLAGKRNGAQIWIQLNHPGKQIPAFLNKNTVAPSAIPMNDDFKGFITVPRALEEHEIENIIERFARSALLAKQAGFDGAQIHGAHGYLVSQFLSPRHNQRTDQWGGSIENRMRFVREIYKAMRAQVGDEFPLAIKLNSADFMKDGMSEKESMQVIKALSEDGINLIEVSGGTYESPEMLSPQTKQSTKQREAYFLEFAEQARQYAGSTTLVVTGGFRSALAMNEALTQGATDMIGMARPLAIYPNLPNQMLADVHHHVSIKPPTTGIPKLDLASAIGITWYEDQLHRLAEGKQPNPNLNVWLSALSTFRKAGVAAFRKRRA